MSSFEVKFEDVSEIIRAAFSGANSKRTVKVETGERYHVSDYWSEGSRNYCAFVELSTLRSLPSSALPQEARQQAGNHFNLPMGDIQILPGYAVVEHCIFRGKDLGYRLYLHASNVTPFLQAKPELSEREKRILVAFRSLKSGPYRQEALLRLGYTQEDTRVLAEKGLLKVSKNGATQISQEGRIAIAGEM